MPGRVPASCGTRRHHGSGRAGCRWKPSTLRGVVSAQAWGTCPQRGDDLNVQPTLTTLVTEGRGLWTPWGRGAPSGQGIPESVEVGCGCEHTHLGAPAGEVTVGGGLALAIVGLWTPWPPRSAQGPPVTPGPDPRPSRQRVGLPSRGGCGPPPTACRTPAAWWDSLWVCCWRVCCRHGGPPWLESPCTALET